MPPIRFACPNCKTTVSAPPERAGTKAKCPGCKLPLEIPLPRGELLEERPPVQHITQAPPQPAADPFSFDQPSSGRYDEDDYRPRRRNRGNGTAALVWALLGFFLFAPLGMVAISVANQALREDPHDGNAKAGLIIGWIDTIFFFTGCCLVSGFFLLIMVGAGAGAAGAP
ncbi:MAG: DUF4190 domain-containing protein [Planctomycetia bacterium]|nr:DUF4190 domain-containing protein [Planctomycetia bacterium]